MYIIIYTCNIFIRVELTAVSACVSTFLQEPYVSSNIIFVHETRRRITTNASEDYTHYSVIITIISSWLLFFLFVYKDTNMKIKTVFFVTRERRCNESNAKPELNVLVELTVWKTTLLEKTL
jgi:hypothetical protein